MEDIIWKKLCQLSQLHRNQQRHLQRSDEHDYNNNSILAGCALSDYHNDSTDYDKLFSEIKELSKEIDIDKFDNLSMQAYRLYN